MRARFLILLIVLLAAPAELRAQLPSAIAHEPPCPVAADDTWTDQEKFVWAKVCAGDVADFNEGSNYGGKIDARTTPFPDQRILSGAFIHTILTNHLYRDAITSRGVRVFGARFTQPINLANVALANELWFENCVFEKGVDLSWLQTSQPMGFNKSKATGKLTLYAAQISGDLQAISSVIDRLDLSGARISRTVDLHDSHVTGGVEMPGMDVGADLKMSGGEYAGINLLGAHVGHSLDLIKSKVTGALQMDSLQVGVYLHFQNATLGSVDLLGAHVQNQLSFQGAKVTGALQMFDMQVGTDLWMHEAEFFGTVSLRSSQVGGHVNWNKTTFHKDVDLSGARIGGELQLSSTKWADKGVLTARYTNIRVIPALSAAWPPRLRIFGLTYDGIADTGDDFRPWFDRQDKYSRQPYEQLAGILQARGEIEQATEVRVAERDRDRGKQRGVIFAWLTLLKYLIGYGYYPYYSIYWIAGFVALGALVLRFSGEGPRNRMPIGLSYSFDMLLPVIRLREEHYNIDLAGRARYYFYFHRIMGWALASFLIAGLSGLTK